MNFLGGQLSELITELAAGGSAELDVKLDDGIVPRLLAYSRSVSGFPTAVKEVSKQQRGLPRFYKLCMLTTGQWSRDNAHTVYQPSMQFEWRNGWFYEQSRQAMEAGTFDPYPRHTEALKEVGAI
jgi:hypothetical protein